MGLASALLASGRLPVSFWRQAPDATVKDAPAIIEDALVFMQSRALNRAVVDWPRVRAETLKRAGTAGSEHALDDALTYAVAALGDRHSHYLPRAAADAVSEGVLQDGASRAPGSPPPPDPQSIATARPSIGRTAVIEIHGFSSIDPEVMSLAARHLRGLVVAAIEPPSCGLLLDVSDNPGGNVWPMLQGVLPLLSPGPLGGFAEGDGSFRPVAQRDGSVWLGERAFFASDLRGLGANRRAVRVALVTSERTGSAAELLTVFFNGEPQARRFGSATAGVNTANTPKRLAHGGTLAIATGVPADRLGTRHSGPLAPDVAVVPAKANGVAAAWASAGCPG